MSPGAKAEADPGAASDAEEIGEIQLSLLTRLLPLAIFVAAVVLFISELMTTFEFTPQGGEVQLEQAAADRHGNALMVIAVFAVIALLVAVFTGSKPAATAVAIAGAVALLFFLLVDLPDANTTGNLDTGFIDAEAVPREGFYMELVGALALAVTGFALATMSSKQLAALRPAKRKPPDSKKPQKSPAKGTLEDESTGDSATLKAAEAKEPETAEQSPKRRPRRRPRARQRG